MNGAATCFEFAEQSTKNVASPDLAGIHLGLAPLASVDGSESHECGHRS